MNCDDRAKVKAGLTLSVDGSRLEPTSNIRNYVAFNSAFRLAHIEQQRRNSMVPGTRTTTGRTVSIEYSALVLMTLLTLILLGMATPVAGEILFSEDFNVAGTHDLRARGWDSLNWDNSVGGILNCTIVSSPTNEGIGAWREHIDHSDPTVADIPTSCSMWRDHTSVKEVWVRMYTRIDNYNGANQIYGAKHYYQHGTTGTPNGPIIMTSLWGSPTPFIAVQETTDCYTNGQFVPNCNASWTASQNKGSFAFQNGQWYCLEARWKLNTPGVRDGLVEMWVDGRQIIGYYNFMYAPDTTNMYYYEALLYNQGDRMYRYTDLLVASTTRVGCSGASSPPPGVPTGVQLR
jgi:hypothetical protein